MIEVAQLENMKVEINSLQHICQSFNNDIRQTLNFMQMWSKQHGDMRYADIHRSEKGFKKDEVVMTSMFEAAQKLMNRAEFSKMD